MNDKKVEEKKKKNQNKQNCYILFLVFIKKKNQGFYNLFLYFSEYYSCI